MSPGAFVAVGFFGAVTALVLYGTAQDIRRWWEDRQWMRDQRRAAQELHHARESAGYRPLPAEAQLREHVNRHLTALRCGWFAHTAEEIGELDEIWGIEDV